MKLTFIEKRKVEGDAVSFFFKPKRKFFWQAGQFLFYTIPTKNPDEKGVTRYFTISAAPSEGRISITTRIFEKPSTFKKSLMKLKTGDEIEASGPDGDFIINNPKRNLVFIAGGIGITPFRSILTEAYHKKQNLKVNLLYANRDENIVFKDELESLKDKNPNLRIDYFISPTQIEKGILISIVNGKSSIVNPLFYISGPTKMVKVYTETLKSLGIKKENIKTDYFPGYGTS